MPLKLFPPDRGKGEASWYIRGTHLGVSVRRSAKTDRRATAEQERKRIKREIEQGRFTVEPPAPNERTFAGAVIGYLKACPDAEIPHVNRLLAHFKDTPLNDFDVDTIDAGEEALYPGRLGSFAAGTLNRMYRGPLAAVLHNAADRKLMQWLRIKRYKERKTTRWLEPDQARALIDAAAALDADAGEDDPRRLAALLILLFTSALRISEACRVTWADVNLARREIGPLRTKNGEEYVIHVGELAFDTIANLPGFDSQGRRIPDRRIFGFRDRHAVKYPLSKACEAIGWVKLDPKTGKVLRDKNRRAKCTFNLHMARHSFATWIRRQEGMDIRKLMDIARIKDIKTAGRYTHVSADEHAPAIARLPLRKENG